jgi:dTDP-4-dehydrorhamnose 3,5-epimerase
MLVQRERLEDQRGFLSRFYCAEEFEAAGAKSAISQINHTLTRRKGTVRGMHFQFLPYAESKFVSCLRGEIFDVAIDLRRSSPTFLKWHGEVLSAQNQRSLLIPEGFAHGFQALTDDCEIIYLHTAPYSQPAEAALNALDPLLAISWPLEIAEMSDRDRGHAMLTAAFEGIEQ